MYAISKERAHQTHPILLFSLSDHLVGVWCRPMCLRLRVLVCFDKSATKQAVRCQTRR